MSAIDLTPFDLTPFGLAVGHATDEEGATGLTVVRGIDAPLRAAAAVIGRATGTREFDALDPSHLVGRVDAVVLTGGSAFGLDSAAGVMRWMEERGRGFAVGTGVVPIVPAAVVFDLAPLGRADRRPTAEMAYDAAERARPTGIAEGSVGAGTGATVGKAIGPAGAMKGGVGCWVAGDVAGGATGGLAVAALAVVNAFGDVRDAAGRILAGARLPDGSFADGRAVVASGAGPVGFRARAVGTPADAAGTNTTLCVVAVNRPFPRILLQQLATAAAGALHRRITPVGTSFDGDVIVALSPDASAADPTLVETAAAEALAVEALEMAIERAVRLARGRDGVPGLAD